MKNSKVFSKGNRKTIAGNNEEGYSVVLRSYNGKEITPMNSSENNEEKNIQMDKTYLLY